MKKIAMIPNLKKDIGLVYTKKVAEYLKGKAELFLDRMYENSGVPARFAGAEIYDIVDEMIVLGGDGTILQAAAKCARKDIPILGVNLGKIGFMSEVETDHLEEALACLLSGEYKVHTRMMLKVDIIKDSRQQGTYHALNDVVVSKPENSKLIYMKLYSDDEFVNSYIADGMIVATPTGSTGYSLSAGGPVVDPLMKLFIATPICPHVLSARSAVMSADKTITLKLDEGCEYEAVVSVDGAIQEHIKYGDEVRITQSDYVTKLIKIKDQSFYDTLIKKLS
jgi:NAD+ kinase